MAEVIYSVWNTASRQYDYFKGPATDSSHAGAPPRARGAVALGATPDQAAWRLPFGAVRIGSGDVARGRIASLGGDDTAYKINVPQSIMYAAIGYMIWKVFR